MNLSAILVANLSFNFLLNINVCLPKHLNIILKLTQLVKHLLVEIYTFKLHVERSNVIKKICIVLIMKRIKNRHGCEKLWIDIKFSKFDMAEYISFEIQLFKEIKRGFYQRLEIYQSITRNIEGLKKRTV